MNKVRSDALWVELSKQQLETLDNWLFEDGLSFAEILPKAQSEIGFKGSIGSLKRYYQRRSQERSVEDLGELVKDAAEIKGAPGDANGYRTAAMKLVTACLFRQVREAPNDVDKWGQIAHLIVDNDHNEALRELRGEAHEIRRESLAFAREKHHSDMIERAMKALPALLALREARKDPNLRRYEHNARWNEARRTMFGPGSQVLPENAQEEAEMLAARKERGEKGLEEDRIIEVQPPPPSSPYHKDYMEEKARKGNKGLN